MKLPVTSAIFTKRKTALLGVALLAASLLSGLAVAQGPATGAAPAKAATGTPTKTSKNQRPGATGLISARHCNRRLPRCQANGTKWKTRARKNGSPLATDMPA